MVGLSPKVYTFINLSMEIFTVAAGLYCIVAQTLHHNYMSPKDWICFRTFFVQVEQSSQEPSPVFHSLSFTAQVWRTREILWMTNQSISCRGTTSHDGRFLSLLISCSVSYYPDSVTWALLRNLVSWFVTYCLLKRLLSKAETSQNLMSDLHN